MSATNEVLSDQLKVTVNNSEIEELRKRALHLKRLVESYELYFSDDGLTSRNIVYRNLESATEKVNKIYSDNPRQIMKFNTYVDEYEGLIASLHLKLGSIKELSKQAQSTAVKSETGGSSSILTQFNRDKNEKVSPKKASSETPPEENLSAQLEALTLQSSEDNSKSEKKSPKPQ